MGGRLGYVIHGGIKATDYLLCKLPEYLYYLYWSIFKNTFLYPKQTIQFIEKAYKKTMKVRIFFQKAGDPFILHKFVRPIMNRLVGTLFK